MLLRRGGGGISSVVYIDENTQYVINGDTIAMDCNNTEGDG